MSALIEDFPVRHIPIQPLEIVDLKQYQEVNEYVAKVRDLSNQLNQELALLQARAGTEYGIKDSGAYVKDQIDKIQKIGREITDVF